MKTVEVATMVQLNISPCIAVLFLGLVTLASSQNDTDRPRDDQKSLMIVFDITGSMTEELEQVKEGINEIIEKFSTRKDELIYNYILSMFDDPSKFL